MKNKISSILCVLALILLPACSASYPFEEPWYFSSIVVADNTSIQTADGSTLFSGGGGGGGLAAHNITGAFHTFPAVPVGDVLADNGSWVVLAGGGDMTKLVYDIDNDGIVDKAENVDDGAGNASTAAQVKTAVTNSHTHANKATLDATQESFTTALKNSYDWLVTNITAAWKTTVDDFIASKGAASGIAPLDATTKVPTVNLGGAGADATKYLRGDQTWVAVGSGATVTTPDTVLVNAAASPVAWTDLDTGLGGAYFVTLAISATADMDAISIRRKGDTIEYYNEANDVNAQGTQLGHHDSVAVMVLACFTDSNGYVQWITEASRTATVTLTGAIGE